MNALIEMNNLFFGRPTRDASDEEIAAWYRAKGHLHERIASAGGQDAVEELAHAAASFEHARRLEQRAAATVSMIGRVA